MVFQRASLPKISDSKPQVRAALTSDQLALNFGLPVTTLGGENSLEGLTELSKVSYLLLMWYSKKIDLKPSKEGCVGQNKAGVGE